MSFQDIMSKVRYWDNLCARWMMRHFYIIFFQFVLVIVFFFFFVNTLKTIDLANHVSQENLTDQLILQQNTNSLIIIFLIILNSFWMLFVFNGINRLRALLREVNYNLMKKNR